MSAARSGLRIVPSPVSVMDLQDAFERIFEKMKTRDCKIIFQEPLFLLSRNLNPGIIFNSIYDLGIRSLRHQ